MGYILGGGVIAVDPAKMCHYGLVRTYVCKTCLTVFQVRQLFKPFHIAIC